MDPLSVSQRNDPPDPDHEDSIDSPEETVLSVRAVSRGEEGSEQLVNPRHHASNHEAERLWGWGLHEDELLVNRMSVSLLAQSILIVAAVGILTAGQASTADRAVEIILDVVGIAITTSLWHVFTLHAAHIKILSKEQKALEPDSALYARVHKEIAESRDRSWVQRRIFGSSRGTKWIMANVISAAILAVWLAFLGAAITSLVA